MDFNPDEMQNVSDVITQHHDEIQKVKARFKEELNNIKSSTAAPYENWSPNSDVVPMEEIMSKDFHIAASFFLKQAKVVKCSNKDCDIKLIFNKSRFENETFDAYVMTSSPDVELGHLYFCEDCGDLVITCSSCQEGEEYADICDECFATEQKTFDDEFKCYICSEHNILRVDTNWCEVCDRHVCDHHMEKCSGCYLLVCVNCFEEGNGCDETHELEERQALTISETQQLNLMNSADMTTCPYCHEMITTDDINKHYCDAAKDEGVNQIMMKLVFQSRFIKHEDDTN